MYMVQNPPKYDDVICEQPLRTHIKSKHEGVKYACNQCDYQATQQFNLTTHIKAKHEGVKYSCDLCDYQLNSKSSLYMHKKRNCNSIKEQ